MSTPDVALRRKLAPWIDAAAARRARLTVVPRTRSTAPRFPFILLLSVMLVGGVVALLCFNTQMQQAAFVQAKLHAQATTLSQQQQSLELELEQASDPQAVAQRAQDAGMVIPVTAGMLHVNTGKITGSPTPAGPANTPRLYAPVIKPNFASDAEKAASKQVGSE
jgi:hypothetical protein